MNLRDAIDARRSIRAFTDEPVNRADIDYAISLAVTAPAPHHSSPWRFLLVEEESAKESFAAAMATAWEADLNSDGLPADRIARILERSRSLLTRTPLLTICCTDMSKAHTYPDDRRRLAEWSLFAHSIGAALQGFMLGLAERGWGSCWISAPVFCRDVVRDHFGLESKLEPHALVLVGRASPDYKPRPRAGADPSDFVLFY